MPQINNILNTEVVTMDKQRREHRNEIVTRIGIFDGD